jgi:hypothetical protein
VPLGSSTAPLHREEHELPDLGVQDRRQHFFDFLPQIVETGAEGDTVRVSTGVSAINH